MDIKDIKLKKGMSKEEVNELISEWITLEDDIYMGFYHKHNWNCPICGEVISNRQWDNVRQNIKIYNNIRCDKCKYNEVEQRYKHEVEKDGEYEYIRSYRAGDTLPNGKINRGTPYIQIKHLYCESIYEIESTSFICKQIQCGKCCGSYENSFAYHIEQELGEPLEKYWNFEKNIVNPYHISRGSEKKVWIKCQEKDYHESYEIACISFYVGCRCSYCINHKVHPKDSFAQYHIDNTDPNFLEKYWDYEKNTIDPWEISPSSNKCKIWIKCQNDINHSSYETSCSNFKKGRRCPECNVSSGEHRIKMYLKSEKIKHFNDLPYFKDLKGVGGGILRPDFILPDHKIWIEYDGEFHFEEQYEGDYSNEVRIHDKLKDEYAKKHGWKMIRIPYWEFDNIENILVSFIA